MADIELATALNSGVLTNIYLGGVTVDDKLLTKAQIDAAYETIANVDALDVRVTANAANIGKTNVATKTISYTVALDDNVILGDATAAPIVLTLPDPATANTAGKSYRFSLSKIDASVNTVTIAPFASETIGGDSSFVLLSQNEILSLVTDGTNWYLGD